jgi:hypothetical protein
MRPTLEEPAVREQVKKALASGECVRVWVVGGSAFDGGSGFVRSIGTDHFEFDHITNPGGYFSNYSDLPELARVTILFSNVTNIKNH